MTKEETLDNARGVIGRVTTLIVCTLHVTGAPDARTMLNFQNPRTFAHLQTHLPKDKLFNYFTTDFGSEKVSEILQNPKTTLYYHDPETGETVTVLGECYIVDDKHTKNEFWDESWRIYFPQGREDSQYTLFSFTPKLVKYYDGITDIFKYQV